MPSRLTVVLVSLLVATPTVIYWLWLVIVPLGVNKLCPEDCWCDVGGHFVDCSNKSLHNIPSIYLTNVQELVLNDNNITCLEKDSFISKGLTELDNLALDRCGLETIDLGAFNGLTKLKYLSMLENGLVEIPRSTFENMSGLEYLGLQYNKLEHLAADMFCGLINLQRINLEGNKLLKLHPDIFKGLPKLERLDLGANRGLQIPTDRHFITSHDLKILNITFCNVSSVSVETFTNVSALEKLDLSSNNLRSIDINILKLLPKLSALYLYNNPLQCDCQLKEVWRWCQDYNIETESVTGEPENYTVFEGNIMCWLEFEELQSAQDNTSNENEYKQKNNKHLHDKYEQRYQIHLDIHEFVLKKLIPFLLIFGTIGNVIIVIIIICNKVMRTVPNMYILNLAISDTIFLTGEILSYSGVFNINFKCAFLPFLDRMFVGLSVYSVTLLSIQRYRVTVKSFHVLVSSQRTWRFAVATICGVWIVAALFAIPSAFSKFICLVPTPTRKSIAYYKYVVVFELLVSCVLPLGVIAFSYIMTAHHLVKNSCPISEETTNPHLKTRKNAAKIVAGLTFVILISYGPFHIIWAYLIFNWEYNLNNDMGLMDSILGIALCLAFVHSCLSPVAIFCTSSLFRKHLKRYLTCFCKANSPPTNIELTRRN